MTTPSAPAIQDAYPDAFAHCFGCGRLNPQGHQLKSRLVGDETLAEFTAPEQYTGGVPGKAYGGLVASLLDCHGTASAAAFAARAEGIPIGGDTPLARFVTASLRIDFRSPTPIGVPLVVRGRLRSLEGRKAWIDLSLQAESGVCATGEMLAVRLADQG
jgi:acyl-coenzyme A thioesterase PaaI-like protein